MFKNVATKIALFAFDTTTGVAKTGDAANLTAYVSKDYGAATILADTSATELSSTLAKGWYLFDVAQAETNAGSLVFTCNSTTANIAVVGREIFTTPANFSSLSIDSNGRIDLIKIAGTTQTARDIGTSVLLSSGTGTGQLSLSSGLVTLSSAAIATLFSTAITEAYSTDGSTVTLANFVYEASAMLQEKSVSSVTLTAKKRDGSTAMTFTLDSSSSPTAITRAS